MAAASRSGELSEKKTFRPKKNPAKQREAPPPPKNLSEAKKRIRDTQRLLRKHDLPSTQRVGLERQLKALEILKSQLEQGNAERENAKKYHRVKFFDRQKILRKLKQIERTLEGKDEQGLSKQHQKQLRKERHNMLVQLNYVMFYPDTESYISLYPSTEIRDPECKEQMAKRQKDILAEIERMMQQNQLPADAREKSADERDSIRKAAKRKRKALIIESVMSAKQAKLEGGKRDDNSSHTQKGGGSTTAKEPEEEVDDFFEADPQSNGDDSSSSEDEGSHDEDDSNSEDDSSNSE